MFKNKDINNMLVEECQYRAVITYLPNKSGYKASVKLRIGISKLTQVACGLKGEVFASKKQAESKARQKMKEQKSLDRRENDEISYIIYDD